MLQAPIPADEEQRLALLAACHIMYTPAEQAFDDVAQLAADLCGAEIALITLVGSDYQWFKARVGVQQEGLPRDLSFCGHCIIGRQPFVVPDTLLDARFADNPLVTGDPYLRSYTGVPLLVDGAAVGALSVADRRPRVLTAKQLASLKRLAAQISRELHLRRDLGQATQPGMVLPTSEGELLAPGVLVAGRWQVSHEIGRGGTGVVYEARDRDGRRVAIKVLLPMWASHAALLERFAREARVLMRLTTPHVAQLLDVGNLDAGQGGLPFLVLEFLEGVDLGRLLDQRQSLDWRQAFAWAADACKGLAEAHQLGVVHRDLKPSNIFLSEPGQVVKLIDFGIAAGDPAEKSAKLTAVDDILGSPAYMSPEQMMAQPVDARSDVWSMGVALYELVSGRLPFPGKTHFEMFARALAQPPVPLDALVPGLPASVKNIIATCLKKPREERYQTIRALEDALRASTL